MKKDLMIFISGIVVALTIVFCVWLNMRVRALENFANQIIANAQRQQQAQQIVPRPQPAQ